MRRRFASRRSPVALRVWLTLALTAPGACSPAHSDSPQSPPNGDWVLIDETEAVRVHVDGRTLRRFGDRVRSDLSFTFPAPEKTPSGEPYDHSVMRRIDDCRKGGFALQSNTFRRADGSDIEKTIGKNPDQFLPNPAGTHAAHLTAEICKLAGLPEPVVASVPLADVEANDWRLVGTDGDGAKVWVQSSSAMTYEGAAAIVTRTAYPTPRTLDDGRAFKSVVNQVSYVCDARLSGVETSDYYGGSGELLLAVQYDVEKTARRVGRGSLSDQIREIACAGPALKVPAGFDPGSN